MPSSGRSDRTRQRLLSAAQEVVAEQGWAAASSRVIADRAGVNLALINYHFGSKGALLEQALAASIEALAEEVPRPTQGVQSLVEAARAAAAVASNLHTRVLLAACVEATRDPELAKTVREQLELLRHMVLSMLGGRKRDRGLATLLAATLDGLLLHRAIDPRTDVHGAAKALQSLLDRS